MRACLLAALLVLGACGGIATAMTLTSPDFPANGPIPTKYTCEGDDVAPTLLWSGVPSGAKTLALVVDDPDAPDPAAPRTTWVHWVAYDISSTTTGLPSGTKAAETRAGLNDWKRPGYSGPCPPIGRHRYVFKLYALDATLGDLDNPTKSILEKAMSGHVLEKAELIGTYKKRT